jgi:hypothetical protein
MSRILFISSNFLFRELVNSSVMMPEQRNQKPGALAVWSQPRSTDPKSSKERENNTRK